MSVSVTNQHYLAFFKDIYEVSNACATTTYIWGGFTIDILKGRFTREHGDLDGFILNLLDVRQEMAKQYEARGYVTKFRKDIDMLEISRDGLHASFNRLEIDGPIAMWRHIGNEGTMYFPVDWLDDTPRAFYGEKVFMAGIQLDYSLKTNVRMISAEWDLREKDHAAVAYLEGVMARENLDPEQFLREIWSFNPFWVKRGHPEYAMPTVARPLHPLPKKEILDMETLVHRRVRAAQQGENPTAICRVRSGWVVLGDIQNLRGYSLLLSDPVASSINDLSPTERHQFSADMWALGDALLAVTDAYRINYEILGNLDPALHAHVTPRYMSEPETTRGKRLPSHFPDRIPFDLARDQALMAAIRQYLAEQGIVLE